MKEVLLALYLNSRYDNFYVDDAFIGLSELFHFWV